MSTVASFVTALAARTRPDRAAAWDPVGLQLGDPSADVSRVAVCHEVTGAVVEAVTEGSGPDLVVAYHPLLFRPTSHLVAGPTPAGRAWRLVDAGVALVVTHTDFDAAAGGTADALASTIGLVGTIPFGPVAGRDQVKIVTFVPEEAADAVAAVMSAAGAGQIGNYANCSFRAYGEGRFLAGEGTIPAVGRAGETISASEVRLEMIAPRGAEDAVVAALVAVHPYEEPAFDVFDSRSNRAFIGRVGEWTGSLGDLVALVGDRLGRSGLRAAGRLDAEMRRVAVVPGSGASFLTAAGQAGADAIVTGDVDHHRAVAATDSSLGVVDPGHAATELPGMGHLVELIAGLGVEVVDLTGDGSGPWVDMSRN
jgi:dinuclear metal center YbgI/SA1388 family protein